jgi:hypothetical protein
MLLRQRQHERRLEGKTRLVAAETKGAARSASGRAFNGALQPNASASSHMLGRAAARRHTAAQLLLAADSGPFAAPGAEAPRTSNNVAGGTPAASFRAPLFAARTLAPVAPREPPARGASLRLKRPTLARHGKMPQKCSTTTSSHAPS